MKPERYSTAQPATAHPPVVPPADPAKSSAPALRAVQVSLDRRDNGGDAYQASGGSRGVVPPSEHLGGARGVVPPSEHGERDR